MTTVLDWQARWSFSARPEIPRCGERPRTDRARLPAVTIDMQSMVGGGQEIPPSPDGVA
jgi:hypothetical protein